MRLRDFVLLTVILILIWFALRAIRQKKGCNGCDRCRHRNKCQDTCERKNNRR